MYKKIWISNKKAQKYIEIFQHLLKTHSFLTVASEAILTGGGQKCVAMETEGLSSLIVLTSAVPPRQPDETLFRQRGRMVICLDHTHTQTHSRLNRITAKTELKVGL